jgi:hypothetical protein
LPPVVVVKLVLSWEPEVCVLSASMLPAKESAGMQVRGVGSESRVTQAPKEPNPAWLSGAPTTCTAYVPMAAGMLMLAV